MKKLQIDERTTMSFEGGGYRCGSFRRLLKIKCSLLPSNTTKRGFLNLKPHSAKAWPTQCLDLISMVHRDLSKFDEDALKWGDLWRNALPISKKNITFELHSSNSMNSSSIRDGR